MTLRKRQKEINNHLNCVHYDDIDSLQRWLRQMFFAQATTSQIKTCILIEDPR